MNKKVLSLVLLVLFGLFALTGCIAKEIKPTETGGLEDGYSEIKDGYFEFTVTGSTKETKIRLLNEVTGNIITPNFIGNEKYGIPNKITASLVGTYSVQFYSSTLGDYTSLSTTPKIIIANMPKTDTSGTIEYVLAYKLDGTIKVLNNYTEEQGKLKIVINNSIQGKKYIVILQQIDTSIDVTTTKLVEKAKKARRDTAVIKKEYTIVGTGTTTTLTIDATKDKLTLGSYKITAINEEGATILIDTTLAGGDGTYDIVKITQNSETGTVISPGIINISEKKEQGEDDSEYYSFTLMPNSNTNAFYKEFFKVEKLLVYKTGSVLPSADALLTYNRFGDSFSIKNLGVTEYITVQYDIETSTLIPLTDNITKFQVIKNYRIYYESQLDGTLKKNIIPVNTSESSNAILTSDANIKGPLDENLKLNFAYYSIPTAIAVKNLTAKVDNMDSFVWLTNGMDQYNLFTIMSAGITGMEITETSGTKDTKVGIFSLTNPNRTNNVNLILQVLDKSKGYTVKLDANSTKEIPVNINEMKPSVTQVSAAEATLRLKLKKYDGYYKITLANDDVNPFKNYTSTPVFGMIALVQEDKDKTSSKQSLKVIKMVNLTKSLKSKPEETSEYDDDNGLSFYIDKERFNSVSGTYHLNKNKIALIVCENTSNVNAKVNSQIYIINLLKEYEVIDDTKLASIINPKLEMINNKKAITIEDKYKSNEGDFNYLNGRIYFKNYTVGLKRELEDKHILTIDGERTFKGVNYLMTIESKDSTANIKQYIQQAYSDGNGIVGDTTFYQETKYDSGELINSYFVNTANVISQAEKSASVTSSLISLNSLNRGLNVKGILKKDFDGDLIIKKLKLDEAIERMYSINETTEGAFGNATSEQNRLATQEPIQFFNYEALYVNQMQPIELIPADLSFNIQMAVAERYTGSGIEDKTVDVFSNTFDFKVNSNVAYKNGYVLKEGKTAETAAKEDKITNIRLKTIVPGQDGELAIVGRQKGQFGQNYTQDRSVQIIKGKDSLKNKNLKRGMYGSAIMCLGGAIADGFNSWDPNKLLPTTTNLEEAQGWSGVVKNHKYFLTSGALFAGSLATYFLEREEEIKDRFYKQSSNTWAEEMNNEFNCDINFDALFTRFFKDIKNPTTEETTKLIAFMDDTVFDPNELNYSNVWGTYIYLNKDIKVSEILAIPQTKTIDNIKIRVTQQISTISDIPLYSVGYDSIVSATNKDMVEISTTDSKYSKFKKGTRDLLLTKGWYKLNMKTEKIGGAIRKKSENGDNDVSWITAQPVNAAVFRAEINPWYEFKSSTGSVDARNFISYDNIRILSDDICGKEFGEVNYKIDR